MSLWNIEPPVARAVPIRRDVRRQGRRLVPCLWRGLLRSRSNGSNRNRSDCSDRYRPHPSVQAVD